MNRCKFALTVGGAMAMGLASVANADETLRSEVAQLRQQVAELKGQNDANWLNERRAEEVKALIGEVLADADTRASLMADGMTSGHNGRNFYVGSADGGFLLTIAGQIQFRYIFNFENNDDDRQDDGFQLRRVKIGFGGHVTAGLRWDYEVVLNAAGEETDEGDVILDDAKFGTQLSDALRIDAGKFKLPFAREELISSRRMLAVERSIVNEIFTLERAEQIQISYKSDMILLRGSISDGARSEFSDIGNDEVEIALTGRVDVKLMGDWEQAADSTAWRGQPNGLFLGGAVHFQSGDGRNGGDENLFTWTVDALFESNGLGVMAAVFGSHTDPDAGGDNADIYGVTLEVSYLINDNWQPFIRGEWADLEDAGEDDCNLAFTAGVNYYFKGHDAKITADVLWLAKSADTVGDTADTVGASLSGTGLGFSDGDDHGEDNLLLRLQFQLLF